MAFVRKGDRKSTSVELDGEFKTPEDLHEFAISNGIDTEPLNITKLAQLLNISISYEPMEEDKSGSLELDKPTGRWLMTVNSLHHPRRQRFTIAHEIGHKIRHGGLSDKFEDTTFFRSTESDHREVEANKFAAELLMPKAAFEKYIKTVSREVEDIADHFQVSSMAVRVRAKELGFKGHAL